MSERYGAGQRMRRQGLHPANLGMADDLPSRLAAEQLSTLAGMSQKVQAVRSPLSASYWSCLRMDVHLPRNAPARMDPNIVMLWIAEQWPTGISCPRDCLTGISLAMTQCSNQEMHS